MKKTLAILLVLAMVLSLAACGEKPVQTTEAPQQSTPAQTQAPTESTAAPTQATTDPTQAPEPAVEELKNLNTYETKARELETWNVHYSQAAADLNILCNLFYWHFLMRSSVIMTLQISNPKSLFQSFWIW